MVGSENAMRDVVYRLYPQLRKLPASRRTDQRHDYRLPAAELQNFPNERR